MNYDDESESLEGSENEDDTLEAEFQNIHKLESMPLDEDIE